MTRTRTLAAIRHGIQLNYLASGDHADIGNLYSQMNAICLLLSLQSIDGKLRIGQTIAKGIQRLNPQCIKSTISHEQIFLIDRNRTFHIAGAAILCRIQAIMSVVQQQFRVLFIIGKMSSRGVILITLGKGYSKLAGGGNLSSQHIGQCLSTSFTRNASKQDAANRRQCLCPGQVHRTVAVDDQHHFFKAGTDARIQHKLLIGKQVVSDQVAVAFFAACIAAQNNHCYIGTNTVCSQQGIIRLIFLLRGDILAKYLVHHAAVYQFPGVVPINARTRMSHLLRKLSLIPFLQRGNRLQTSIFTCIKEASAILGSGCTGAISREDGVQLRSAEKGDLLLLLQREQITFIFEQHEGFFCNPAGKLILIHV